MSLNTANVATKTNFSANGQTLELDVSNLSTARFEFSGTYNFTAAFETLGLDGTSWFPLQVVTVNTATVATAHSTTNATQAYEASVHSVSKIRVRLTAFTSAATHFVGISASSAEIEPAGTVQVTGSPIVSSPTGLAIAVTTAATTNASSQKATAGNLFEIQYSNPTATAAYVKLYNKATAPTVGTDVPIVTELVAAGATIQRVYGQNGKRFTLGIAMAVTAGALATDTAVAVAGVQIHGTYV